MALNGDHQPVNRPLALAWLALAAERGTARFTEAAEVLRKRLPLRERRESDMLLRWLQPVYADAAAATRAEARYADVADVAQSGDRLQLLHGGHG